MPLRSMTGFGRAAAERDGVRAVWELRAVNGRGLDLRARVPGGLDAAERAMRAAAKERLSRGSVQIALAVERVEPEPGLEIDPAVLDRLVAEARGAAERHGLAMPDVAAFMGLRGVLRAPETEADPRPAEAAAEAIDAALDALVADREREGAALRTAMEEQLDRIAALTERAAADPSRAPDAIASRLRQQVARLVDAPEIDRDRLHAEAALLAVRADLAEELDRLRAHVEAARELLDADEPAGRRLDFLAQEFAREANTLCAKSNAATVTAVGLDLKVAIDQFREQTQNVE